MRVRAAGADSFEAHNTVTSDLANDRLALAIVGAVGNCWVSASQNSPARVGHFDFHCCCWGFLGGCDYPWGFRPEEKGAAFSLNF